MREPRSRVDRRFVWGLVLVLLGAMLMFERFEAEQAASYWPFVLILFGIVKIVDPPRSGRVTRSKRPGAWLLFIGLWGLVSEFRLFGLDYSSSWPVMIVGVGLMLVWRSFEGPDVCERRQKEQRS